MASTRGARATRTTPTIKQALAELRMQADALRRSVGVVARSANLALSATRAKVTSKVSTRSTSVSRAAKPTKAASPRKPSVSTRASAKPSKVSSRTVARRMTHKTGAAI